MTEPKRPSAPKDMLRAMEAFPDARVLLARYGLSAKKQFGQNFLISDRAFRAIVDATVKTDEDWVVEIGAGLGTLTMRLAERLTAGKLIALEFDPDMVRVLRAELDGVDNVEIEHVDAMRYDLRMAARWRGDKITVCGNLPYHVSSQLMFKVIDAREHITHAVFMIQKEMADRIVAPPGGKDYGAIGVMLRTYADVTTVAKVGAGSFVPPPKIDSTVIRMVPLAQPRTPITDEKHYSAVVHAAFGQRRKTLRNALRAAFPADAVDAALTSTGIDGQRRGETLEIAEFGALAQAIGSDTTCVCFGLVVQVVSDPLSSSEWAQRGFCGECGTSLFYFLKPTKMYAMAVGAFDDQEAFQLVREIFIDRKPSGFAFAGGNRVRHNLHNFRVSCASCV